MRVKDYVLKRKLITTILVSNLSPAEIHSYTNDIKNKELKQDIIAYIHKQGYTPNKFKVGESAVDFIFNKISQSKTREFLDYIKEPLALDDFPIKSNFFKISALSKDLVLDLIAIEPGADETGSAIGKGEVFLALSFSDVSNRDGGGDLDFKGENLEIKGIGGRLGQQPGRGSDFNYVEHLARMFLPKEKYDDFVTDKQNYTINICIQRIYKETIKSKRETVIEIQRCLDSVFFNKGLAKNYFNKAHDFKNLDQMKKNLLKINAKSYAIKSGVGVFLFLNTKTADYVLVDYDSLDEAIDFNIIDTVTKSPIKGYRWTNPHPSIVIR